MPSILVVDDQEEIRSLLCTLLSGTFEVTTAENGMVALQHIANKVFDAIVLDLEMPALDGAGLIRELHTRQMRPRVLVCSGHPDIERRARAMGASDYLPKPFTARRLRAKLKGILCAPPGAIGHTPEPVSQVVLAAARPVRRHARI